MNQYFEVIQQAMILYPVIVVLVTIPYIAWNYHKYGSVLSLRVLIVYSFILYLLCVYCLVILPLPSPEEAALLHGRRMQLTPFAFVGAVIRQAGIVPGDPATWRRIPSSSSFWTTLFNLFMTLPFGVYLRYYFCCGWKKTLGLAFGLSLFCELTQLSGLYFLYPGSYRLFDVDDLIVNTAGSMVGYALAGPLEMLLPSRQELDAASFQRGTEVSFPRRVFSFGVDLVCVELLSLALGGASALLGAALPSLAGPVLFWAYFALVPLVWQGRTPGKRLTRQRIVHTGGGPARPYQYALRYGLLLLGLWGAPRALNALVDLGAEVGMLNGLAGFVLWLILSGGYLFYLFYAALMMAFHRPLYYEKWSRTETVSTVEGQGEA